MRIAATFLAVAVCTADPAASPPAPTPAGAVAGRYEDGESLVVLTRSPTQLSIELRTKPGFHLNDDYPINFVPKVSDEVTFAEAKISKAEMKLTACTEHAEHQCTATVPVLFTAKTAQPGTLGGTFAYAVCDPSQCLIKKVPLEAAAR